MNTYGKIIMDFVNDTSTSTDMSFFLGTRKNEVGARGLKGQ